MVHLRIVVPSRNAEHALDLLRGTPSVCNLIHLGRAAEKPEGDVILCDVAREDASIVIEDLRELGIPRQGSIAIEEVDSSVSEVAERAEAAARGFPSDAVVWEEVETQTSESTELSGNFLAFMALACMLAAIAIVTDSTALIIGAMVVGPEFGPIAGLCVAAVQRRLDVARRSLTALAIGFPVGIFAAFALALLIRAVDLTPSDFSVEGHPFTGFAAHPDALSFAVAVIAGTTGLLSLTSAKSGALVGVLVSVATIPATANIGVAAAYGDTGEWLGAMAQLAVNLAGIMLAGVATLFVQRRIFARRRVRHEAEEQARRFAGLPIGRRRKADVSDRV